MSKQESTGLGAEVGVDARPNEDQFARQRRQDAELVESTDRAIERARQADARKADFAAFRPRYEALRRMAHEAVAHRSNESAATRRAALHRHPVYLSLAENERRAWDILVDEWTETIHTGDLGTVWRAVGALADRQASGPALAEWSPPPAAETESPADLAALIPRG